MPAPGRREAAPGPSVPRYRAQVTPGLLELRLPGRHLRPLRAAPPGRPHHDPCAGFAERPHSARDGAAALPSAAGGAPQGRGRAMALLPALLLLLLPLAALAAAAVLLGLPGYDIPPGVNQPAKLRLVLTVLLGTAALVSGGAGGEGRSGGSRGLRGQRLHKRGEPGAGSACPRCPRGMLAVPHHGEGMRGAPAIGLYSGVPPDPDTAPDIPRSRMLPRAPWCGHCPGHLPAGLLRGALPMSRANPDLGSGPSWGVLAEIETG